MVYQYSLASTDGKKLVDYQYAIPWESIDKYRIDVALVLGFVTKIKLNLLMINMIIYDVDVYVIVIITWKK